MHGGDGRCGGRSIEAKKKGSCGIK
jgi:hypothetical protein